MKKRDPLSNEAGGAEKVKKNYNREAGDDLGRLLEGDNQVTKSKNL